jgi:hypothetical protein
MALGSQRKYFVKRVPEIQSLEEMKRTILEKAEIKLYDFPD